MNNWQNKFNECRDAALDEWRYHFIKKDLRAEGMLPTTHPEIWTDRHFAILKEACILDKSLFDRNIGFWTLDIEPNKSPWAYERRFRFWLIPLRGRCFWCEGMTKGLRDRLIPWGRYKIKTLLCRECDPGNDELTQRFDNWYHLRFVTDELTLYQHRDSLEAEINGKVFDVKEVAPLPPVEVMRATSKFSMTIFRYQFTERVAATIVDGVLVITKKGL